MKAVKIFTYNPKNQKSEFEFYALSKGLNSGKPLDSPCPNCFVISCRNEQEKDIYRSLLFGLWQSKAFHQFLVGSVIPFVRISDFKNFVFEQAKNLKGKEHLLVKDIHKFKILENQEKRMQEQLLLISELKRMYIRQHLRK